MSSGNSPKPKKGSRVGESFMQPTRFASALELLKRADVMLRIGLCLISGVLFWLITAGWERPFPFREGETPERAITARVPFTTPNDAETKKRREAARDQVVTIYRHDRAQIEQIRTQLFNEVRQLTVADSYEALQQDKSTAGLWQDFLPKLDDKNAGDGVDTAETPAPKAKESFAEFKAKFQNEDDFETYKENVESALSRISENGLLNALQHKFDKEGGNQGQIRVYSGTEAPKFVELDDVLIDKAMAKLKERLDEELSAPLARHTFAWFSVGNRLKETLTFDRQKTLEAEDEEAANVEEAVNEYKVDSELASSGEPITGETLVLLEKEHEEVAKRTSAVKKLALTVAHFGMYAAIFSLCGFYSVSRKREVLTNKHSLIRILCLSVVTLLLCRFAALNFSETVLIPLLLFSMTIVIAYDQEVALLLSTVMALIVVVALGFEMKEFAIYVASMATSVLCLRYVRSRTKLIYVGLTVAAVGAATAIGAATLADPNQGYGILISAAWYGFFAVVGGLLMTGLLPFIESLFDIQTELSLLELSDISHPLLQELVRRAPGTYHHTMNVASIAEAAAEAIDANGLLVRVGAYFHDIGKMLKPGYFIENQSDGGNRHESLLPAMSTLVIIAHVKDGADLARQHNLPNSLVDFIMQHHGTTLVEYFYNRANEESKADPDGGDVDEHSYRYPGPKPQTKEAAVLMLADTVESACRSLTDPTPSRIEGLVQELAMKKLLDGQFEECGLTLSELKKIETSLIKSLAAVYHARIKYPDQQQSA